MQNRRRNLVFTAVFLIVFVLLAGCNDNANSVRGEQAHRQPSPTPPPATETATAVPPPATVTIAPTETPTLTPTAMETAVPTASPTATIMLTSTPDPKPFSTELTFLKQTRWQYVQEAGFYSPSRDQEILFTIFTPPGYEASDARYPVLYFMHGVNGSHILFFNAIGREVEGADMDAGAWLARLINEGALPPLIVVGVSSADGDWGQINETMVTEEIIAVVDANWRTVAGPHGRGLMGFSMGGVGVGIYASGHPDLYCSALALSGLHETTESWQENLAQIQASELTVGMMVGELDKRPLEPMAALHNLLIEARIDSTFTIVPDVPHNFGQLVNATGLTVLQFHTDCFQAQGVYD